MTEDRVAAEREAREAQDYMVAFSPKQVGGFMLVAALIVGFARWIRRPRGKA
jgi:hypothetical protein